MQGDFDSTFVIHRGTRFIYMPQSWDMDRFFHFPSEGRHAEDFSDARKIQRVRPGLNPRTRVPEATMLTTRPPKPLITITYLCTAVVRSQIGKRV
jgi:hypothetical protein